MLISYDDKFDLLYIRLIEKQQQVLNKRIDDSIVLDIGEDNKIVGIEILDASEIIDLHQLLPVHYATTGKVA